MRNIFPAGMLILMSLSLPAKAEDALAEFRALKPEIAFKLAQETMSACRDMGYQVAVAVTDRFGNIQVLVRDQLAGMHTPEIAERKAWTAASFKSDTQTMMEETQAGKPQSGVRFSEKAIMVAGGLMIEVQGSLVGAIGVSGAPGGIEDEKCAKVGLEAIEDDLPF